MRRVVASRERVKRGEGGKSKGEEGEMNLLFVRDT